MKKIKIFWMTFLLELIVVVAHAGTNTGADFLKLPIGAHAVGVGQAANAGLVGVDALNWNPAATDISPVSVHANKMGLSFSHQQLFSDNNLDHFGFTVPAKHVTMGFNVLRVTYSEQEARAQDRSVSGHFTPSDTSIGFNLASGWNGFHVGSQVKWISQRLASEQAQAMAVDLGLLSQTPISKLTVGASMRNWGQQMKFISESYDLPLTFSAGASYLMATPLTVSLDVINRPYQHQTSLAFGAELNTSNFISLRAGYLAKLAEAIQNNQKSETNRGSLGGIAGMSAGLGLRLNQFRLDYAFAPSGELGLNQIITLSTYFSGASFDKATSKSNKSKSKKSSAPANLTKPVEKAPEAPRQIIIFDPDVSVSPFVPSK